MKRPPFFLLALASACLALSALHAATDDEVAAHRTVLDLAGAFTNDGFKIRDGNLTGVLQAKETSLVQVNLFAGNQYWFSVATADPATKVSLEIFDEAGQPVKTDPYASENSAAAGFAPEISGPYFVRVRNISPEAPKPATFCLIYSYK